MATDDSLSRSLMLLCFGAAGLLFLAWRLETAATPSPTKTAEGSGRIMLASKAARERVSSTKAKNFQLVVKLSERRVYLYSDGKLKAKYAIAVGQPGWETPTGNFKVLHMRRRPVWRQPITGEIIAAGPDNPLGDRWIGFWSNGRHQIGFHGTNTEQLVGKPVSHGCLRMRNQDIREMYEQVSEGTPVIVRK